jgi:hypothetical protein
MTGQLQNNLKSSINKQWDIRSWQEVQTLTAQAQLSTLTDSEQYYRCSKLLRHRGAEWITFCQLTEQSSAILTDKLQKKIKEINGRNPRKL